MMIDAINLQEIAAQCAPQVHYATLITLIQHESNGNPFAIGVNGHYTLQRQPKTLQEAIKKAQWLKARGYDFDAGLAQINIRNAQHMGLSIPQLFDPCENLRTAAKILTTCYERASEHYKDEQKALRAALSCYNTGNLSSGLSNGYVKKMIRKLPAISQKNIVAAEDTTSQESQVIVPNVMIELSPAQKRKMHMQPIILRKKNDEDAEDNAE